MIRALTLRRVAVRFFELLDYLVTCRAEPLSPLVAGRNG